MCNPDNPDSSVPDNPDLKFKSYQIFCISIIAYANFEFILIPISWCDSNPELSVTVRNEVHKPKHFLCYTWLFLYKCKCSVVKFDISVKCMISFHISKIFLTLAVSHTCLKEYLIE